MGQAVTVVIPAFNEAAAIGPVVDSVRAQCAGLVDEVIVVDDGSSDRTAEIAEQSGARVIRHTHNRGYGGALKTGIRAAQSEFVLTMDSDGQHSAEDVKRLIGSADANDLVVGQRTRLLHSPLWRMPGKWLLTWLANYLTGQRIPDLNSGLRLIRREVAAKYLHVCPNGFSFSTTLTMCLLSRGYQVSYVPIDVKPRIGTSTVSLRTGLETLILVLRLATLFNPLRIFLPVSMLVAGVGLLWGIPYATLGRGVSVGSMLAIVTSIVLFALGLISDQISQLRLERFE